MTHPTPTAPTRAEIDEAIQFFKGKYTRPFLDDKTERHFSCLERAAKSGVPSEDDRWCSEDSPEVLRARAMGFKVKVGKHKSVWFEDDRGRMSEQAFFSQRELVFYMNGLDAAKYGGKAP